MKLTSWFLLVLVLVSCTLVSPVMPAPHPPDQMPHSTDNDASGMPQGKSRRHAMPTNCR